MSTKKKAVSFWARKPVKTRVKFKTHDGKTISFIAKVRKRKLVKFKARK